MGQFGGSVMRGGNPVIFSISCCEGYNTSKWIYHVGNVICESEPQGRCVD